MTASDGPGTVGWRFFLWWMLAFLGFPVGGLAGAHPDPREGGRCHPHALPGPALNAAFPRLLLPGEWRCSGVSRSL